MRPSTRNELLSEFAALADPKRAKNLAWFFKTGNGQYGEGDQFLGISVPLQRKVALRYKHLSLADIARLLKSRIHEHRFAALEILVARYESSIEIERTAIVDFYLSNLAGVNNWDLVDTSAPYILGHYLRNRSKRRLVELARSTSLWERRIAIVTTLALIKAGDLASTFRISRMLLSDPHDLIHKAVGWALRETGNASPSQLLAFLKANYAAMPRTALRYAIEKFPPEERKKFLSGQFE